MILHAIQSPQICFFFKCSVIYTECFILLYGDITVILLHIHSQRNWKAVLLLVNQEKAVMFLFSNVITQSTKASM